MKSTIKSLKQLLYQYRHGVVFSYFILYLLWFFALEKSVTTKYTVIHIWLDDIIPFNELFIIPYLLWFAYIAAVVLYFFLQSTEDFYRCIAFLFIGMTVCLIIYTIWPNGQHLRPTTFERDNIFVDLVKMFYRNDTPTNVCPSIHAFNSIGAHIAISRSEKLKNKKIIRISSFLLMVSICLSTMFLKQHSAFDVICAMILALVMYLIVYIPDYNKVLAKIKQKYGLPAES